MGLIAALAILSNSGMIGRQEDRAQRGWGPAGWGETDASLDPWSSLNQDSGFYCEYWEAGFLDFGLSHADV
jgi:hypothetical protein